jgi:hypothetical protein
MRESFESLQPAPAWATASGCVDVHQQGSAADVLGQERALVSERIARYGWSFDERDRVGLADCFTPEANWEGSIMGTTAVGPFVGRESITEFLAHFWEVQRDQRRHIFSNIVTNAFTAEGVTAHAYLLLTSTEGGTMAPISAGPYRFELERSGDEVWRISRLTACFDAPF